MNTENTILEPQTSSPADRVDTPQFSILGVRIDNVTRARAIELLEQCIQRAVGPGKERLFRQRPYGQFRRRRSGLPRNAQLGRFRLRRRHGRPLGSARLQGVRVAENLVGTDFVPVMFQTTADRGYSYFMLGADDETVGVAADYARRMFPGWTQAGAHHGLLERQRHRQVGHRENQHVASRRFAGRPWATRSKRSGFAAI